ncbi:MAG: hypothetical protein WD645_06100 [Dehalococcoidia bacterium]
MPEGFQGEETYEVLEMDGNVVLVPAGYKTVSNEEVARLTRDAIAKHRKTLEGLAR